MINHSGQVILGYILIYCYIKLPIRKSQQAGIFLLPQHLYCIASILRSVEFHKIDGLPQANDHLSVVNGEESVNTQKATSYKGLRDEDMAG